MSIRKRRLRQVLKRALRRQRVRLLRRLRRRRLRQAQQQSEHRTIDARRSTEGARENCRRRTTCRCPTRIRSTRKPLKDFAAYANDLKNQGKLDLNKPFEIVIEAELDEKGKLKNPRRHQEGRRRESRSICLANWLRH